LPKKINDKLIVRFGQKTSSGNYRSEPNCMLLFKNICYSFLGS